tara:strand:+ start:449 stop:733 length:285 start_codon:yes stop_codon:yes gene_type:complete
MDIMKELSEHFDKALLDVLVSGRKIMDKDGDEQVVDATAADLNVIRQRLKDCGITAQATDNNPLGSIIEEMKSRGMAFGADLPEMNQGDDAATA